MIRRTVTTVEALHARPLDRLVQAARGFACDVRLRCGDKAGDGKNVVQLLLMGVGAGVAVTLTTDGDDEEEAMEVLVEVLEGAENPEYKTRNTERGTGNGDGERGTGNAERGAGNAERGAGNVDRGTGNVEGGTKTVEGRWSGVGGAPGLGQGRVRWVRRMVAAEVRAGSVEQERRRVELALQTAAGVTRQLACDDDPFCDIFEAQLTLLEDPALPGALVQWLAPGVAAEQAAERHFQGLEQQFEALDSAFARERHADVADVRDRLLEALDEQRSESGQAGSVKTGEPVVLVLQEATPSRLATLDLSRVAAVISLCGGPTSHAAIVARGRGIPLVFAPNLQLECLADGQWVSVNGESGLLQTLKPEARGPLPDAPGRASRPPPKRWTAPAEGSIAVQANLGAPGDLATALELGCDGCGLLRSELLYQGRSEAPTAARQADAYSRVARALAPRPLVVRLFDAGSDKPLAFLPAPQSEPNPALGLRGLRLLLQHPAVLSAQLEAIIAAGDAGDVRLLVPMVTEPQQLAQIRRQVAGRCVVGAMIETPAAAVLARELAQEAQFLSVGSNDLAQYTLAADRQRGESVPLHPAVLRLVETTARAARQAQISCSVCGELASHTLVVPLLAALGLTLSVAPAQIPRVRATLGRWTADERQELLQQALLLHDPQALTALLHKRKK